MRLFEGAVGPTRLAQATATAHLDSQQRLAFHCHLEPAQARQTGHVKLSGSLPLLFSTQMAVTVRTCDLVLAHAWSSHVLSPGTHLVKATLAQGTCLATQANT